MKYLIILLLSILLCACGQAEREAAEKLKQQQEREATFTQFQAYLDNHYANWKVKGVRKDETGIAEDGTNRAYYYLLLNDGKTDRTLFVALAEFQLIDGTKETHIYEPSKETLRKRREEQLKKQGVEDERNYDSDAEGSYDPND